MKSLTIAIGIVVALGAALFSLFHLLGVGDKVAGPMASSALGFITFVHDKVDKALSSGRSQVTPGIVPVSGFDIDWPYMMVYATLIFIGITEASSGLYVYSVLFLLKITQSPLSPNVAFGIATVMAIPIVGWSLFILGRWVGIRSARAGYWILPLSIVVGRAIDIGLVLYFSRVAIRPMLAGSLHNRTALVSVGMLLLILVGIGMLGVWRGNRVRFGAYFNSLLKQVSGSTRDTLLAMTFEEARASEPPAHAAPAAMPLGR